MAMQSGPGSDRILQHAQTLIQHLYSDRSLHGALDRPIIFICHSLGGIVVKRALVYSESRTSPSTSHLHSIFTCTYSILFFGTPHHGTGKARLLGNLQQIAATIIPKRILHTESNLVKALEEESETLQKITDHSVALMTRFRALFLWEQDRTAILNDYVVEESGAAPSVAVLQRTTEGCADPTGIVTRGFALWSKRYGAAMSLPPERISIKRRRQDEPVDTLYLEHGTAPDKKRRVTDFYFQRVRDEIIAPISSREKTFWPKSPQPTPLGVPAVRWTSPGEERRDLKKLKASIQAKADTDSSGKAKENQEQSTTPAVDTGGPSTPISSETLQGARRFHLTSHLSSALSPHASGGIRKHKTSIRPPLATFVERHVATFSHEQNPLYRDKPVDKLLETLKGNDVEDLISGAAQEPRLETLQSSNRKTTATFLQASHKTVKTGTSIKDHPSTWDHESDQLADELAALAMELDPGLVQEAGPEKSSLTVPDPPDMLMISKDQEDDYVYETYIRVRYDDETQNPPHGANPRTNIGLLIIEEEDEGLWQKYVDSEDDTDWDEEDSNAEDNPSNDYPEEEISSDDEYGYNVYKYRHHGSDDEAYDDGDDDDDDDDGGRNSQW
ncbi:uncharacterized protein Z518_04488 [Rhinocladiella mackenziei CBS 650.93]|uniref:Transcription factor Iwr1 domain-containing protein n=1 Tax=Rhinocladiella mackenziei CBS 650.93 TaxID=1442369 RepID=A0A0D2FWG8_9EURO|nr:uncharacterized protein Z518_04488 [Rhinocladiella mackenziei CBS 650.93]KIX06512.1 hypothetical protein Z518_04488 [Rhinocladiella mackenziei CBS 650.93]